MDIQGLCLSALCKFNMPGYFEDHDTTKTKKGNKYNIIWADKKQTMST